MLENLKVQASFFLKIRSSGKLVSDQFLAKLKVDASIPSGSEMQKHFVGQTSRGSFWKTRRSCELVSDKILEKLKVDAKAQFHLNQIYAIVSCWNFLTRETFLHKSMPETTKDTINEKTTGEAQLNNAFISNLMSHIKSKGFKLSCLWNPKTHDSCKIYIVQFISELWMGKTFELFLTILICLYSEYDQLWFSFWAKLNWFMPLMQVFCYWIKEAPHKVSYKGSHRLKNVPNLRDTSVCLCFCV